MSENGLGQGREDKNEQDGEREHPAEARARTPQLLRRVIRAVLAVGVAFVPCLLYSQQVFTYIAARPLLAKLPKGSALVATGVWTPFLAPFKLSLYMALVIAVPYVLYQAWAFAAPGLFRHRKHLAVALLVASIVLFYVGAGFAYEIALPAMFRFPDGVSTMIDINAYLDAVLSLFFWYGLAFELPVAIVLLVLIGGSRSRSQLR